MRTKGILGSMAGLLLWGFGKRSRKPSVGDLRKLEFKASSQRIGVRFTEKIRDIFRKRWLRKLV